MAKNRNDEDALAGQEMPADVPRLGDATPVDPLEMLLNRMAAQQEMLTQAVTILASRGGDSNQETIASLTRAMERMSEATIEGAKLQTREAKRAFRPSNEIVPNVSVFNRRGETLVMKDENGKDVLYAKPKLKCPMWLPWGAENETSTREEIELLNLLEQGDYILKRIDNSKIRLQVLTEKALDNVTVSKLVIKHETAFQNDNFGLMPALDQMLRQLLKQHSPEVQMRAALVLSDEDEEAMIAAGELAVAV